MERVFTVESFHSPSKHFHAYNLLIFYHDHYYLYLIKNSQTTAAQYSTAFYFNHLTSHPSLANTMRKTNRLAASIAFIVLDFIAQQQWTL